MDRATISVYEQSVPQWHESRPARLGARARAVRDAAGSAAIVADAGCGSGSYLPHLGAPVFAFDAARAMVVHARSVMPDAWLAQAALEAIPVRRGALGAVWARASYVHVARTELPLALGELHRATAVGAPLVLTMLQGDDEGALTDDDFPGRFFARWPRQALVDVVTGAGFEVGDVQADGEWWHLHARRARTLADSVRAGLTVLVVGLNPSLYAADAGVGFARPGNRFWPAARAAGLVERERDLGHALIRGIGFTDVVKRATVGAKELDRSEYRAGFARLERLVAWLAPGAVCFVGLAGWRAVIDRRAAPGVVPVGFAGRPAYLMPNPSGLNAHTTPAEFAAHLRAAWQLGVAAAPTRPVSA
jgi:TDG/mug DNA glycosylase family protein